MVCKGCRHAFLIGDKRYGRRMKEDGEEQVVYFCKGCYQKFKKKALQKGFTGI